MFLSRDRTTSSIAMLLTMSLRSTVISPEIKKEDPVESYISTSLNTQPNTFIGPE
jgi:hypothetical protein